MPFLPILRRATLLGLALGASACDIVDLVSDPAPRLEQTWNVPGGTSAISVASLLPPGNVVQILPDSSAFSLTIAGANIAERVGNDCAQCQTLNGTTTIKPAFVLTAANSASLPTDVASAAVLNGQVNLQLTNNMSFDPIRVRTAPGASQGFMVLVVHSGSLVLGRDSINGATTPWVPGSQLNRVITLATGTVTSNLTIDVTINSPQGDNNVFINADGTLNAVASVPTMNVASIGLNVPGRQMTSIADTLDLEGLDASITESVIRGEMEMTFTNPFAITGNVNVEFIYGALPSDRVTKTIAMPTGVNQVRSVVLDADEMSLLFGKEVGLSVTGAVNSAGAITVTPKQAVSIVNRLILTIRTRS
jgi:hypothetical protein